MVPPPFSEGGPPPIPLDFLRWSFHLNCEASSLSTRSSCHMSPLGIKSSGIYRRHITVLRVVFSGLPVIYASDSAVSLFLFFPSLISLKPLIPLIFFPPCNFFYSSGPPPMSPNLQHHFVSQYLSHFLATPPKFLRIDHPPGPTFFPFPSFPISRCLPRPRVSPPPSSHLPLRHAALETHRCYSFPLSSRPPPASNPWLFSFFFFAQYLLILFLRRTYLPQLCHL